MKEKCPHVASDVIIIQLGLPQSLNNLLLDQVRNTQGEKEFTHTHTHISPGEGVGGHIKQFTFLLSHCPAIEPSQQKRFWASIKGEA